MIYICLPAGNCFLPGLLLLVVMGLAIMGYVIAPGFLLLVFAAVKVVSYIGRLPVFINLGRLGSGIIAFVFHNLFSL